MLKANIKTSIKVVDFSQEITLLLKIFDKLYEKFYNNPYYTISAVYFRKETIDGILNLTKIGILDSRCKGV